MYNQIIRRAIPPRLHLINNKILILLNLVKLLFSLWLARLLLLFLKLRVVPLRRHFQILIIILLILLIVRLQGIYLTRLQNILIVLKLLLIGLLTWYAFISVNSWVIFSCFAWAYLPIVSWVVFYLSRPIFR